jgi:hypothetical protein
MVEYYYKFATNEAARQSSFEVMYEFQPPTHWIYYYLLRVPVRMHRIGLYVYIHC